MTRDKGDTGDAGPPSQPRPPHPQTGPKQIPVEFGKTKGPVRVIIPGVIVVGILEVACIRAAIAGNYLFVAVPLSVILGLLFLLFLVAVPALWQSHGFIFDSAGIHWQFRRKKVVSFPWETVEAVALSYQTVHGRLNRNKGKTWREYPYLEVYATAAPWSDGGSGDNYVRSWQHHADESPPYGEPGCHYHLDINYGPPFHRYETAFATFQPQKYVGKFERSWRWEAIGGTV